MDDQIQGMAAGDIADAVREINSFRWATLHYYLPLRLGWSVGQLVSRLCDLVIKRSDSQMT